MLIALLVAATAAASAHDFDHPDAYTGEDGCRYIRVRPPKAPPRRSMVVQYLRPPQTPDRPASAPPAPFVVKRKVAHKPQPREEVPGYVREDCDDVRPPTPFEVMLPPPLPFSPVPDEPSPPNLARDLPPEVSPPVLVPDLPQPEGVEGGAPQDWVPAYPAFIPRLTVRPAVPEPATWYLLIASFGALFWVRRR